MTGSRLVRIPTRIGARRAGAILLSCSLAAGCGLAPQLGRPGSASSPPLAAPPSPGRVPVQLDSTGRHVRFHYQDQIDPAGAGSRTESLGTTLDLASVELGSASAQPGQEIVVSNVPMDAGKVRVAILNPDGSVFNWVMIRDLGSPSKFAMIAPLLPVGVAVNGAVRLKVYVRGAGSPTLTLHLAPLAWVPPALGTDGALKSLAAAIDGDPLSGGATSSVGLLAHLFLDSPANPNSIQSLLAGTAPMSAGSLGVAPSSLDSVFAATGATSALEGYRSALEAFASVARGDGGGASAFRVQGFSVGGLENLISSEITTAIGQGQSQSTDLMQLKSAESELENGEADAWNGLAGVAAALATDVKGGTFNDAMGAANAMAVVSLIQTLYDLATLPSRVTLDPPAITQDGADLPTGAPFIDDYPADAQKSMGTWSVSGEITNAPVSIQPLQILGQLTGESGELPSLALQFYTELNGNISATRFQLELCSEFSCDPSEVSQISQAFSADSTLLQTVNTILHVGLFGATSDLQYDPSTSTLFFAPGTKVYYQGPLTKYCQAEFSRNGVLVPETGNTFLAVATGSSEISIVPQVPFFSMANQAPISTWLNVVSPPTPSPSPSPSPTPLPTPPPPTAGTSASLTIGTGASAITYTAVTPGPLGNEISIAQRTGGVVDIYVQGESIYEITGSSTAAQIAAILNSIPAVRALVTITTPGGGSGLPVYGISNLAGGSGSPPGQYFNPPNLGDGLSSNAYTFATVGFAPGYSVPDGSYLLQEQTYQNSVIWNLRDSSDHFLWQQIFPAPGPANFTITWGSGHGITVWPYNQNGLFNGGGTFAVDGPGS